MLDGWDGRNLEEYPTEQIAKWLDQTDAEIAMAKERVAWCEHDLRAFAETYLGHLFTEDLCTFHTELFSDLSKPVTNKRMARIAPRGHGKTTIVITTFALWNLCYRKKSFILLFGSMQGLANQNVEKVMNELETNDLIREDFKHLEPAKDFKNQWVSYTDSQVIFESGQIIAAKGLGGAVRGTNVHGKRPDLVIIDDPERDQDVQSANKRDKLKRYVESVI